MRPPAFWNNSPDRPGWQSYLLAPLSSLYALATARRVSAPPDIDPPCPVICVGNINVGGTGKTPVVIALIERLGHAGVHIVSRGYGGREEGPIQVDPRRHSAADVGDEPLLLAAFATTWVAKDRAAGVMAAAEAGASCIIMDDGFQNPSVKKSLSIVVVDAETGFGNGRVIPSGPLREPASVGLHRADLLVSVGPPSAQDEFGQRLSQYSVPRVTARLEPLQTGMDWEGLRVLAFAGIGRPAKFFATLRGLGADLVRAEALDDHQPLGDALMKRLEAEAAGLSAQLVTTEKDAVRLPQAFRQKVLTLPVRLRFDDTALLDDALSKSGVA